VDAQNDPLSAGLAGLLFSDPDEREQGKAMAAAIRGNARTGLGLQALGAQTRSLAARQLDARPDAIATMGGGMVKDADQDAAGLVGASRYGNESRMLKIALGNLHNSGTKDVAEIGAGSREKVAETNAGARDAASKTAAAARIRAAEIAVERARATQEGKVDPQRKAWYDLSDKYNPSINSGRNPLGMGQTIVDRINRVKALPESVDYQLTPQEVTEFALAFAGAINGGGSGGQIAHRLVQEVRPETYGMSISNFLQKLTSEPQDAGVQAFTKRMMRSLAREHDTSTANMKSGIRKGLVGHLPVVQQNRDLAEPWMKESGFTPEEIQQILSTVPPTPAGHGAPPPPIQPAPTPSRQRLKFNAATGELE
jgi:hypothetical protein